MMRKYRGWSIQDREREYVRLKSWFNVVYSQASESQYDAFIDRITRELGV